MSFPSITVVGAGIAGLTLGRCLQARGVPFAILERKSLLPTASGSNYAIQLHPDAYRPVLKVLNWDEALFRDHVTSSMTDRKSPEPKEFVSTVKGACPYTFRCPRKALEKWLREGLEIRLGVDLKIKEHLSQKTGVDNIQVGADGAHSQIRQTAIPNLQLNILPYAVFYGTRILSYEHYQTSIYPYIRESTIEIPLNNDALVRVSITSITLEQVIINYTYSRPARQSDPLYRPNRSLSEASLIPEEFYAEVEELREAGTLLAQIFNSQIRKDKMVNWLMRSMIVPLAQVQDLAERGILLIGDAAHTMPILGGEGANMAMKDGIDLADHLAQHGLTGIRDFYSNRYRIWKEVVERSEQRLTAMHIPVKASL